MTNESLDIIDHLTLARLMKPRHCASEALCSCFCTYARASALIPLSLFELKNSVILTRLRSQAGYLICHSSACPETKAERQRQRDKPVDRYSQFLGPAAFKAPFI